MTSAPVTDLDMFSAEAIRNARQIDDDLREMAPAVKLSREDITIIGRHEHVKQGLADWRTFSSASRPFHDPNSPRPEILLTDDPPRHTDVRQVVAKAMSKRAMERWEARFRDDAKRIVDSLLPRSGEVINATADISRPFVYKALPDVIGLPEEGREHMEAFGHMVWATLGPTNELFEEAMTDAATVGAWISTATLRDRLAPDSLGMSMFEAADAGEITDDDALLLVQTIVAASADTTVMTLSAAIRAFCEFPDQWELLRRDRSLVRNAFDESLRWDSPSRMAGRITTADVDIDGITIPAGERCGLLFAAANRDPRRWDEPDRFIITRDLAGQLGWGFGVHLCVGRQLAVLEADALLSALLDAVDHWELAGEPEPWMTTIGHGPASLPVRFQAA
jgi:4-methoxybenzoate monooxygenase (O-demethylating)